jgi:indolepyruvate ferredoxin oxidoreductase
VETPLGRKRRINQSACNVDLSCLKGFCPSFVTLPGPPVAPAADMTWQSRESEFAAGLAEPVLPVPDVWRGLFAGIGGGGIVTAGAILAMAAHLEGRHVKTLDFTGLAQKNGAVVAHVQIATDPDALDVVRIPLGTANLMLAADLAVGCSAGVLERNASDAAVIGNLDLAATADFKRDALLSIDALLHRRTIEKVTDAKASVWLHGVLLAERLFGNSQAMNTLLLGLAWQRGLVPVGEAAILRAIELNGAAVGLNKRAFLWGRILAERPDLADEILGQTGAVTLDIPALIEARAAALVDYQSTAYAARYRSVIEDVRQREIAVIGREGALSRAAAEGLFRVMAYKDEYEVARLHALATYAPGVAFHMSPPLITRIDARTGRRNKIAIPGWLGLPLFRLLRRGKALRGSALDPLGYQAERKAERALVEQYILDLRIGVAALRPETLETVVSLASLPDQIRGFGPVKDNARAKAEIRRKELLAALNRAPVMAMAAE